jgi:polysaccharide deacetylase 2 family uncharacterized protein YibQ
VLALAYFTFIALLAALIVVVTLAGNPSDGEPVVTLNLTPRAMPPQVVTAPAVPRLVNGNLVADPALIEKTSAGPLPIIAADGRKPMQAYARPFDAAGTRPHIAVVIGGLGLSAAATKLALDHLPPAITLSFAPYASDLQYWVDQARAGGHEVLVEVPMEPFDFPASDPGPHTLLTSAGEKENIKRLYWALSRVTGYVGVTNLLGGRFLSEDKTVAPMLAELTKRGLLFFDNGANSHSVAVTVAVRVNAPAVTGTLVLDAVQDHMAIEARLAELELQARESGAAIASGILYPITIQQVAEWAATLERRGFVLAPISAMVARHDVTAEPPPAQ